MSRLPKRTRYFNVADELVDIVEVRRAQGNVLEARYAIEIAMSTAARKAQVRVLEELEGRIDGYEVVFDSIRERLDSGDDL